MSDQQSVNEADKTIQGQPVDAGIAADVEAEVVEATPIAQLAEQLAAATQKADENWEKLLRVQAEMENLRRRTEREVQDARKFALEKFAKELLVVLDSLELGIQAASGDSPEIAKLREGNELTLKQFQAVMERFQVQAIDPIGQPFNPEQHQAMAMEPSADAAPNTVVKVFQKGYMLNERLLRPAMVVIAQAAAEAPHVDEQA